MKKTGELETIPAAGTNPVPYAEVQKRIAVIGQQSVILGLDVAALSAFVTTRFFAGHSGKRHSCRFT